MVKISCMQEIYAVVQSAAWQVGYDGCNECHETFWSDVKSPAAKKITRGYVVRA